MKDLLHEFHPTPPEHTRDSESIQRLWVLRGSGQVLRWHTMPYLKQDVGQHTFNVCHIIYELCRVNSLDPRDGILLALFHDIEELHVGDLPAHIKRAPGVGEAIAAHEAAFREQLKVKDPEQQFLRNFSIPHSGAMQIMLDIVKAADRLEALMTCVEALRRGNHEYRIGIAMERLVEWLGKLYYIPGLAGMVQVILNEAENQVTR